MYFGDEDGLTLGMMTDPWTSTDFLKASAAEWNYLHQNEPNLNRDLLEQDVGALFQDYDGFSWWNMPTSSEHWKWTDPDEDPSDTPYLPGAIGFGEGMGSAIAIGEDDVHALSRCFFLGSARTSYSYTWSDRAIPGACDQRLTDRGFRGRTSVMYLVEGPYVMGVYFRAESRPKDITAYRKLLLVQRFPIVRGTIRDLLLGVCDQDFVERQVTEMLGELRSDWLEVFGEDLPGIDPRNRDDLIAYLAAHGIDLGGRDLYERDIEPRISCKWTVSFELNKRRIQEPNLERSEFNPRVPFLTSALYPAFMDEAQALYNKQKAVLENIDFPELFETVQRLFPAIRIDPEEISR